ncbi:protein tyrosine phosphatase [Pseudovirgaria hyperparasitica]|uniref:Very-long-chain (3R)-3-hydroxyacyl-CoA dehydratase n=1 Tax=Pseudovirgaria hyperparasitica TaxID=470096 RepID=A0A6A6WKM4_9PEZI|nr:protein tyrosine phosphatase [Pseudovirgaria hyperparasitica]KAF2762750.1 protein tyrosine phosphatase [Pseudovirgaria hyperparasitica]
MASITKSYLILYNFVSAGLWTVVLARTATIAISAGPDKVFPELDEYVRLVQTGALLEVVHSLVGLVRAPLFTTLMQVASRLLLVWGIAYTFPSATAQSPTYPSMLVAWSVTEVIRYSYFVFNLVGSIPGALTWLRYNTFFILYPLGITSECWCIYEVIRRGAAKKIDQKLEFALWAVLVIYIPGAYILYTHMMKQRRRIMRGKQKAK